MSGLNSVSSEKKGQKSKLLNPDAANNPKAAGKNSKSSMNSHTNNVTGSKHAGVQTSAKPVSSATPDAKAGGKSCKSSANGHSNNLSASSKGAAVNDSKKTTLKADQNNAKDKEINYRGGVFCVFPATGPVRIRFPLPVNSATTSTTTKIVTASSNSSCYRLSSQHITKDLPDFHNGHS